MPVEIFRNDDGAYVAWLSHNPSGWVVDAKRRPSGSYLKLHRAGCRSISALQAGYSQWTTGDYIKVCAGDRTELEAWANSAVGAPLQAGCHCVRYGAGHRTISRRAGPPTVRPSEPPPTADDEGFLEVRSPAVIPFDPTDPDLLQARERIRRALLTLRARAGQLLHGVVEGSGLEATDIDNALVTP